MTTLKRHQILFDTNFRNELHIQREDIIHIIQKQIKTLHSLTFNIHFRPELKNKSDSFCLEMSKIIKSERFHSFLKIHKQSFQS
jgi:hypothetical protein